MDMYLVLLENVSLKQTFLERHSSRSSLMQYFRHHHQAHQKASVNIARGRHSSPDS